MTERAWLFDHVYWVVYWSVVFGGAAAFVHMTWPWGLLAIPLAAVQIKAQRELERRHGRTCTTEACAYDNFVCPNGCLDSVEADD